MTQMLLFDGPAAPAETNVLPATDPIAHEIELAASEKKVPAPLGQEGGLHHMGDLARLVLLRYDLVAKRRARMAGQKAAK